MRSSTQLGQTLHRCVEPPLCKPHGLGLQFENFLDKYLYHAGVWLLATISPCSGKHPSDHCNCRRFFYWHHSATELPRVSFQAGCRREDHSGGLNPRGGKSRKPKTILADGPSRFCCQFSQRDNQPRLQPPQYRQASFCFDTDTARLKRLIAVRSHTLHKVAHGLAYQ